MENNEVPSEDRVYSAVQSLKRRVTWAIALLILVLFALVGAFGVMILQVSRLDRSMAAVNSTVVAAVSTATPTQEAFTSYYVIPESIQRDGMTLGAAQAAVTVEMFSDYQCPYCKHANDTVNHTLIEQYVKTGKIKFVYRPFNFLGEESLNAANAAYCALDQNRFWEFKESLFANQNGENQGAFRQERLIALGKFAGIKDMGKFTTCVQKNQHSQQVSNDNAFGQKSTIQSVPTYFVNGENVKDGDIFKIIDTHLSK
jgi:protein-disulfide isomerase